MQRENELSKENNSLESPKEEGVSVQRENELSEENNSLEQKENMRATISFKDVEEALEIFEIKTTFIHCLLLGVLPSFFLQHSLHFPVNEESESGESSCPAEDDVKVDAGTGWAVCRSRNHRWYLSEWCNT